MNREKHEKRNFWLLLALAVVAGLGFLIWGQYNTVSTIFDMGFLRRNAAELMTSAEGVKLEGEAQEQYDALLLEGEEWIQKAALKQGSWKTESIVPWFGEAAGITLSYDLYTQGSDHTVILLHGFQEGAGDVRYWGSFWWDRGWDVLIPQLRSYGAGDEGLIPCTYGVYEQFDLYDLIMALGLDRKTLVIQGRGTGAAAAVFLTANGDLAAAGVDGIVAESVYANMGKDAETMVKKLFGLGNPLLLRFLNAQIRQKLGFLPESVDLTAAAANSTVPALLVWGEDDGFLDPNMTRKVSDAWAGEHFGLGLKGGHRLLWAESGEAYRDALDGLLEQVG